MATLELVRIEKDGKETVLEVTPVPDGWTRGGNFYSLAHIKELEKHYKRTGKPKKSHIDVLYVTRPQVEKWDTELLEKYAPSLQSAREEGRKKMEAKDRLLTPEQMIPMRHKWEIRDAQDKLSFKAGQESKEPELEMLKEEVHKADQERIDLLFEVDKKVAETRQAVMKEVVEWITPRLTKISVLVGNIRGDWTDPRGDCRAIWDILAEIEAKLKEWE